MEQAPVANAGHVESGHQRLQGRCPPAPSPRESGVTNETSSARPPTCGQNCRDYKWSAAGLGPAGRGSRGPWGWGWEVVPDQEETLASDPGH